MEFEIIHLTYRSYQWLDHRCLNLWVVSNLAMVLTRYLRKLPIPPVLNQTIPQSYLTFLILQRESKYYEYHSILSHATIYHFCLLFETLKWLSHLSAYFVWRLQENTTPVEQVFPVQDDWHVHTKSLLSSMLVHLIAWFRHGFESHGLTVLSYNINKVISRFAIRMFCSR